MYREEITAIRLIDDREQKIEFKSCDYCIHREDSEEQCVLRKCVHAIGSLRECYTPETIEITYNNKKLIEPLSVETVPMQFGGRDSERMWNKINEIIKHINGE